MKWAFDRSVLLIARLYTMLARGLGGRVKPTAVLGPNAYRIRALRVLVVCVVVLAALLFGGSMMYRSQVYGLNRLGPSDLDAQTGDQQHRQDPPQLQRHRHRRHRFIGHLDDGSNSRSVDNWAEDGDADADDRNSLKDLVLTAADDNLKASPGPRVRSREPKPLRSHPFKDAEFRIYTIPAQDVSPRCQSTGICDGNHECGKDGLGCVTAAAERQAKVREAARWAWAGYRKFAWGHDELDARDRKPMDWFGMGLTIVDSLDTLLILKLHDEYLEARHWVVNYLDFNQGGSVSVFETTIRILGGLLSAYYHSGGDQLYLRKALEFGERILPAFNSSTGIAAAKWDTRDRPKDAGHQTVWVGVTNLAEAGTLSMEFTTLTHLTGRREFQDVGMLFWSNLLTMQNEDGLYCTGFNAESMTCAGLHYTFGAAADSCYEYMLKQWILSGGRDETCLGLYRAAIGGMRQHLLAELYMGEDIGHVLLVADGEGGNQRLPKGSPGRINQVLVLEHLTCFMPGLLTLGHMYGIDTRAPNSTEDSDLLLAARLMKACYELYHQAPSGLAYDSTYFRSIYPPPPPPFPPPPSPPPGTPQTLSTASNTAAMPGAGGDVMAASSRHLLSADGGMGIIVADSGVGSIVVDDGLGSIAEREADVVSLGLQGGRGMVREGGVTALDGVVSNCSGSSAAQAATQLPELSLPRVLDAMGRQHGGQQQSGLTIQEGPTDAGSSGAGVSAEWHLLQAPDSNAGSLIAGASEQQQQLDTALDVNDPTSDASVDSNHQARQLLQGGIPTDAGAAPPAGQAARVAGVPPPPVPPTFKHVFSPRSYSNFLRPEVVESLFYLWRATGDEVYREWGWNMFRAFEMFCKLPTGGYVTMDRVELVPPMPAHKMESFFLAETLKYFYLLFSDDPDEVPLDEYVFNTEAHPFPIWGSESDMALRARMAAFWADARRMDHTAKATAAGKGQATNSGFSARSGLGGGKTGGGRKDGMARNVVGGGRGPVNVGVQGIPLRTKGGVGSRT